jgi:hypothetical protein
MRVVLIVLCNYTLRDALISCQLRAADESRPFYSGVELALRSHPFVALSSVPVPFNLTKTCILARKR